MSIDTMRKGLELTEEEAFALLGLCITSPNKLDPTSEKAIHKLAEFCRTRMAAAEATSRTSQPITQLG